MKKKRDVSYALMAFVLLLNILVNISCSHEQEEKKSEFLVTSPMKTNKEIKNEYVGQIHAIQHIEIRSMERGYLQEIFVDEGEELKKGQKMFQILPLINEAEFKKAKAEVNIAKIEYKNTKSLANKNVVSANELALSKAKYQKARAELKLAKAHLDFTIIKAPFDGIMGRFYVRLGSLVEEGELLTTLADNSQMWVYYNVSESDYLNYQTQRKKDDGVISVELKMANGKIFDHKGKVETIEGDFNNETGTIAFRATFPNPDQLLRHGETGNVLVSVLLKDALVIPQKATFEILDKKFVYIVGEKNKIKSHQITVGDELPNLFVVNSGLKENDKILVEGLRNVEGGQEIEVNYQAPKEVVSKLDLPAE